MQTIHRFSLNLEERGYLKEGTCIKGITFFYRGNGDSYRGILCVDTNYNASITTANVLQAKMDLATRHSIEIENVGRVPSPDIMNATKMMLIVFSAKREKGYHLSKNDIQSWVVDTTTNSLVIYENRPMDFWGIKETLERALDVARQEELEYKKNPVKRMLYRKNGMDRAYINTAIVVINILVFFWAELGGNTQDAEYLYLCGGMYPQAVTELGEIWRLLTATFLHAGFDHLFNNMLLLFLLGDNVERVIGHIRYLVMYITAALGASVVSFLFQIIDGTNYVSVGASGAIFGMLGGLLYLLFKNKGYLEGLTLSRMLVMVAWLLYNGFTSTGVDNAAHVGGLIVGLVMTMLLISKRRESNSNEG